MCFLINHENSYPKIAQKDIICYKVLNKKISPYTNFVYKKNTINKKIILKPDLYDKIHEGYHSCKKFVEMKYSCNLYMIDLNSRFSVYEMIIPKGTIYYENDKEYVSETIILKRKAFFYSLIYKYV